MGLLKTDETDQKPLARKFFNALKKEGVAIEFRRSQIESVKLSSSGEWLIIECEKCTALLNANSNVGKNFWSLCQEMDGKVLYGLDVCEAGGKLGFDIEPNTTIQNTWKFIADDEKLIFGGESSIGNLSLSSLNLNTLTPTPVKNTGKTGGKIQS